MGDWDAPSHDGNDEDDQDEYEDGGRDRLLGFMFGNVDGSGDLDVDYLDKDAKEHLAALANQLGPSLADIDVFVEAVGRYGMNYKIPTMYNLRVNLLRRQVKNIDEMKKMHEEQWRLGGCTLMSDGWTDRRQRSVINFLVNSPVGTFYLHSIDASAEEKTAQFIADGLENAMKIIGPENVVQLTKSPSTSTAAFEHDYDEKAEDAVDYEDIDEQYEGPEVQVATEEDHLLSKEKYLSSDASFALSNNKISVFDEENYDEENYDEDEEAQKEIEVETINSEVQALSPTGEKVELSTKKGDSFDEAIFSAETSEPRNILEESENEEYIQNERGSSLPILCIEDGMAILRFSEIFGVHEPLKKRVRRDDHRFSIIKDHAKSTDLTYSIEDDETTYLKSSQYEPSITARLSLLKDDFVQSDETDSETMAFGIHGQGKDSCFSSEPMKHDLTVNVSSDMSYPSPKFYPLDQQNWEDEIIWGNSPPQRGQSTESCLISESDTETFSDSEAAGHCKHNLGKILEIESNEQTDDRPISSRISDSMNMSEPDLFRSSDRGYHPQMLRLESSLERDGSDYVVRSKDGSTQLCAGDFIQRFSKISLQNKDLLEESWLDHIIWDSSKSYPRPKLILDLQDERMLFELLDNKDAASLQSHSGAMIINHMPKSSAFGSSDHSGLSGTSAGRFNISNDTYYSSRKVSQQLKTNAKKRSIYNLKIMHSVPALRLQTMKPKLSSKEIANFHRPKALWYPRDNKEAAKLQGEYCRQGLFKVILKTLTGKFTLLRADVEETASSILGKSSKKLDIRLSEKVRIFYSGKELEYDKSLASQNVLPNSVLHLVRTRINCWRKAEKLPAENKPLRPPAAFKKKSDLSVKNGHVFMVEYCEERPLLLGNIGMGAKLCTYYQKVTPGDQTASSLPNGNSGLGITLTLEPRDKSPFLGEIGPGCSQSSLETNMYRAPLFSHELPTTDYLLVRSPKGRLSLRRINRVYVAGQQEPHMEVMSPGTKNVQNYIANRLSVYVHREFRAKAKMGFLPFIQADELSSEISTLPEPVLRKRLKSCANPMRDSMRHLFWVMRENFSIFDEDVLRRMVTPENVCLYESMQTGLHRLKSLGIKNLTLPVGLSAAMSRLPDEAIALAAASHIERELQITPWNLSSNFVACTNQDKENIERLEITGVGDPTGRGLGFSYVRVAPKPSGASSSAKKKAPVARVGSTVTGTDADLRRLSMDAAREVLMKFNILEENIVKMTRWHRIAMIRRLSSEQSESGIKVDTTTLSKFARGQRMSFVQLQQQAREKCQKIWDRQVQSLSAADGDENDSEANSDLDSFAGDLENLLDAEEFDDGDEGDTAECKSDKSEGVRVLKMRRCPSHAQTEEEIEEDREEASAIRRLLVGDESDIKKMRKASDSVSRIVSDTTEQIKRSDAVMGKFVSIPKLDVSFSSKEIMQHDLTEMEILSEKNYFGNNKVKKGNGKLGGKIIKDKKAADKPVRENFVCGACKQHGHMRTNKNCPKYGEEADASEADTSKAHLPETSTQLQIKTSNKKSMQKGMTKAKTMEAPESSDKSGGKLLTKVHSLKVKCGPSDRNLDKNLPEVESSTRQMSEQTCDMETEAKSTGKINKIIISSKMKPNIVQPMVQKPSVIIRLPAEPRKKIIIKQPRSSDVEQLTQAVDAGVDRDFRKTKRIAELAPLEEHNMQDTTMKSKRLWEEEEKRRSKLRNAEERKRRISEERIIQEEQHRLFEIRMYEEDRKRQMVEQAKVKKKKKKTKKHEFKDEYLEEYTSKKKDRRALERERAAKRYASADFGPSTKRRRGPEVILSNILESIVDKLRENTPISYLFLKPVTKKEAPDYFDVITKPMDLATIKERVRRMEYKNYEDFRHDMWQITYNAHAYNDSRNPDIPPLADQLLEICDYLLDANADELEDAEAGIKQDS